MSEENKTRSKAERSESLRDRDEPGLHLMPTSRCDEIALVCDVCEVAVIPMPGREVVTCGLCGAGVSTCCQDQLRVLRGARHAYSEADEAIRKAIEEKHSPGYTIAMVDAPPERQLAHVYDVMDGDGETMATCDEDAVAAFIAAALSKEFVR